MSRKPRSVREARAALASLDEEKRETVRKELEAIGASEITDILAWDKYGRVEFKGSDGYSNTAWSECRS